MLERNGHPQGLPGWGGEGLRAGAQRGLQGRGEEAGSRAPPPLHPTSGPFQIKKECLACRGAAAVFDMSYFGKFYLVGPDARKAADWLFSADVSRPPGTEPRWATLPSRFCTARGTERRWQKADPVPLQARHSSSLAGPGPP